MRRRREKLVRRSGEALPPVARQRAEHVGSHLVEAVIDAAVRQALCLLPDDIVRDSGERALAITALEGVVGGANGLDLVHRRTLDDRGEPLVGADCCEDVAVSVELNIVDDASAAADAAAAVLVEAVRAGRAVGLSGGSTPRVAYERAAGLEADWSTATLWLVDERCVLPADPLSNTRLVQRDDPRPRRVGAPVPRDRDARRRRGCRRPLRRAPPRARACRRSLFLGVGSDGHTASLFPDAPSLAESERLAVAADAGMEPFVPRITMTLAAIAAADHVVFLVTGEDKAERVRQAFATQPSTAIPASLARSAAGRTTVILDRGAAGRL